MGGWDTSRVNILLNFLAVLSSDIILGTIESGKRTNTKTAAYSWTHAEESADEWDLEPNISDILLVDLDLNNWEL